MEDVDIKKYAFEGGKGRHKIEIKNAIEEIFGVTVIKVTTTHHAPQRNARNEYPAGKTQLLKKAVVKLSARLQNISEAFRKAWHKGGSNNVNKILQTHNSRPQTDDRLRL